jgi:hypothetical protein
MGQTIGLIALAAGLLAMTVARLRSQLPAGASRRSSLTLSGMMLLVAWVGVFFGIAHWLHTNFATVYAPSYREDLFSQVRIGMTRSEIASLLGTPLRKAPKPSETWQPDDIWVYSEPPGPGLIGDNYWRRWVIFDSGEAGKVVAVVNDYYVD